MKIKIFIFNLIALFGFFQGCGVHTVNNIFSRSPEDWSIQDCRQIIADATATNFKDEYKIIALATPFTPTVVIAIGEYHKKKKKLTREQFQADVDEIVFSTLGLYIDFATNQFVDKRGNFYKGDIRSLDSLTFLLTLKNKTWPCISPTIITSIGGKGGAPGDGIGIAFPLFKRIEDFCYSPDISDLESHIYLLNDRGERIAPRFVWGKRMSILNREETLIVMFSLAGSQKQRFLENSRSMILGVEGFDREIRLTFDLTKLK